MSCVELSWNYKITTVSSKLHLKYVHCATNKTIIIDQNCTEDD